MLVNFTLLTILEINPFSNFKKFSLSEFFILLFYRPFVLKHKLGKLGFKYIFFDWLIKDIDMKIFKFHCARLTNYRLF
jgi:hypothetical protein